MQQLGMACTGLALTTSPVVAASRYERIGEDDDEDGREACGERCPVDIDQAESIIRLVEADIRGLVRLIFFNVER